jgi:hypothetical protein
MITGRNSALFTALVRSYNPQNYPIRSKEGETPVGVVSIENI